MRNNMDFGIRRVAAIVLAAVALTQIVACGSAPKNQPSQLSNWNSPQDCRTDYASAVSSLAHDKGAAPALLVDSIGSVWNCTTIPEGRYDAEVVVRWSNGWRETALDAKDIAIASGQRLVARAYERDKGPIPASFSDVGAQPDPARAAGKSVTPGWAPESQIAQAPANESVIPASAPEPQVVEAKAPASPESTDEVLAAASPDQAPSPGAVTARTSPHPAVVAAAIVTAPIWLTVLVAEVSAGIAGAVIAAPFYPVLKQLDAKKNSQQPARLSRRPAADCCFVWIEDGLTGEVIAGTHPFRN